MTFKCIDLDVGKLITPYEFEALTEKERKSFEAHLLNCDFCFQSLYAMSPVVELMGQNPETFLPALAVADRPPRGAKVKGVCDELRLRLHEGLAPLPLRRPAFWRIAAPAVAVAVVLLTILVTRQAKDYSDLARIEPVQYIPLAMRGGEVPDESEGLFNQGMELYAVGKYPEATGKLSLAAAKKPENVEAHFYLGLCHLLSYSVDSAIVHLAKAIELGGNSLLEKSHWYLGNAYLLKEDGERGLVEFKKVVEMEGDYQWEAREIIAEIERVKANKQN